MYTWLTYDTQTGAIGTHEQSHPPMIQTTTVTVGSDTPEVTTTSTTTLTPSTVTTYSNLAQVTLTGMPDEIISGFVLTDASGNKWSVPNTTLDESGTATATATCEVTASAVSVAANGLTISGTVAGLTGVTNQASVTTTTTVTVAFDTRLILPGFDIIGPFDGVTAVMSSEEQAAYDNPQAYLYQSGSFVANPNWPAQQLAQAKSAQIALIEAGYQATLNAGFTSSANGTAAVYGYQQSDVQHMNMIASASALGVETWPINYADKAGQIVQLTQAQFASLVTTASQFNWAQINQLRSLVGQVEAATTVSAVQAVVWVPASY